MMLDDDIRESLRLDIEANIVACCGELYGFGQLDVPYPAAEPEHYTRLIMTRIDSALDRQAQRSEPGLPRAELEAGYRAMRELLQQYTKDEAACNCFFCLQGRRLLGRYGTLTYGGYGEHY